MKTKLISLLAILSVPAFAAPPAGTAPTPAPAAKDSAAKAPDTKAEKTDKPDKATPTADKHDTVKVEEAPAGATDAGTPAPTKKEVKKKGSK